MIVWPLLKRNLLGGVKPFLVLLAVMCMYTSVIIYMFNPEFADMLNDYQAALPEMMAAVGMTGIAASLLDWIKIYLYGFIMMLFPLIFIIILVHKLVMGYVDSGSMANLLSTPNSRTKIIATQIFSAIFYVTLLMVCITAVGIICSEGWFPGELKLSTYVKLNASTLLLQLALTGIAFLAACCFNESKYYYAMGAGIPILFFLIQMLSNMGEKLEKLKYFTIYTLLPADEIISGQGGYLINHIVLAAIAIVLFGTGAWIFTKRDLPL